MNRYNLTFFYRNGIIIEQYGTIFQVILHFLKPTSRNGGTNKNENISQHVGSPDKSGQAM